MKTIMITYDPCQQVKITLQMTPAPYDQVCLLVFSVLLREQLTQASNLHNIWLIVREYMGYIAFHRMLFHLPTPKGSEHICQIQSLHCLQNLQKNRLPDYDAALLVMKD
jgi:hypothetical protein